MEPIRLEVATNFDELRRYLADAAERQMPFATAVALTALAKDARALVVGSLPNRFTIRSTWVERGIRFKPAEKRDWPYPSALVYSRDEFMRAQEFGGVKRARGARELAQPLAVRRTIQERTTPAKWPGALLKKPRTFVRTLTQGPARGQRAVLRRSSADRYPLQVLYVFSRTSRVAPRFGMRETVAASVARGHAAAVTSALERALKPKAPRTSTP